MTTSDWITPLIGIYAAIVSTIALGWNILRERRNVVIKVSRAIGVGSLQGQEVAGIEIINNGRRPINIQEVGFLLSNKKKFIDMYNQDIGLVNEGDGKTYYIDRTIIDDMRQEAKKINVKIVAAYVRDSTNNYYKCKMRAKDKWITG
ncbi:MAG: hypothetical protein PHO26_06755 [Dehalococcoidia bacterium]|nr:hypothetical protein [Dehalococcoidia bacterium]MDD5494386.1 hypothetical protein [Dehalococcoidia bacterium]